jgi:thiol:disulfide interchange protein DsbD
LPAVNGQDFSFATAHKKIEARFEPAQARRGETVKLIIRVELSEGVHTYPTVQPFPGEDPPINELTLSNTADLIVVGKLKEPANGVEKTDDKGFKRHEYYETAVWEQPVVISPNAAPGAKKFPVKFKVLLCNERTCLPPRKLNLEAEMTLTDAPAVPVESQYQAEVAKAGVAVPPPTKPEDPPTAVRTESKRIDVVPPAASIEDHTANLKWVQENLVNVGSAGKAGDEGSLLTFLLSAAFWGLIALVTPCVFPMIPITVSFFLKQSESKNHRPIRSAMIYCGTIIVVLGFAAMTLLTVFRALSVHPITNILLGLLFVAFALSLLGMYDITLPSGLARFTSSREGKGGTVGIVFMALTFTIVSFTCVAPFLGGFAGMAEKFHTWKLALGALTFSTTFAAPFFLLALFPSLIKKLPKSGAWLNAVKVVMGFLEIAAALKFFRTAELRILPVTEYFTYDLVLGIWVALTIVCGLYLLKVFRLPHDHDSEPTIGVVRMLLGLGAIAIGIYLTPALFKRGTEKDNQRPNGVIYAWVDAFLLPEPSALPWSVNLRGTIEAARKEAAVKGESQFIFLDQTGVTCTNCQYNENNVFRQQEIRDLLLKYRLVQHYTDEVRAEFYLEPVNKTRREGEAEANLSFQNAVFKNEQLPLYAAIEVTKDKVYLREVYLEGKINSVANFTKFLRDNLKPYQTAAK